MSWLFGLGLLVWLIYQHRRIVALERKVERLSTLDPVVAERAADPVEPASPSNAEAVYEPPAAEALKPEAPAQTHDPIPAAPTSWTRASQRFAPEPAFAERNGGSDEQPQSRRMANWLAENGLAWMGGGALALGGLLMVAYAAQRGFFTPPLRIASAVLVGGLMIAASEWIRRGKEQPGGRHRLAAAALAGAGAATLYGAFWAAYALYDLIPLALSAALLTATCISLLALALAHVEALAIVALLGAFLAPALTETTAWRPFILDGYLVALVATGYAAAALKRWGLVGSTALFGAVAWSFVALQDGQPRQFGLLLLAPLLAATGAVVWRRMRALEVDAPFKVEDVFAMQPAAATALASLISVEAWVGLAGFAPIDGAVLSGLLAVAAAVAVALRTMPGWTYAAPAAAATLGAWVAVLSDHQRLGSVDPFALFAVVLALAFAAFAASLRRPDDRTALLASGSIGAAAFGTIVWKMIDRTGVAEAWLTPALAAAAMIAGAMLLAKRSASPSKDRGLALWIAGAAELLFLAIYAGTPMGPAPAAQAAAALLLALAASRLGWKGLAQASVAGAFVAFASLLRPALVTDVLRGGAAVWIFAAAAVVATALQFAASRLLARAAGEEKNIEALETAALVSALWGCFLLLHRAAGGGSVLGPLMEASLRTDLILAAAVLLAFRAKADDGAIARWRLRGILVVGVVHGLVAQGLGENPWWGGGERLLGPPLLDTLAPAYLAPAALLVAVLRRGVTGPSYWTRATAAAALVFGLLWALLSIRHAFHPAALAIGACGRAETGFYAILAAATAAALLWLRARPTAREGRLSYLAASAPVAAWTALAALVLVFWLYSSPWWGADSNPLASFWAGLLLMAAYALGAVAVTAIMRYAPVDDEGLRTTATCVAVGQLFVLLTLLIRWAFRGVDMHGFGGEAGLETWAFSAGWALFGLGVLVVGGQTQNLTLRWLGLIALVGTLAKALLFDMARLDGVIRAGSFLAVGALLVVGALAARRFNAGALLFRKRT